MRQAPSRRPARLYQDRTESVDERATCLAEAPSAVDEEPLQRPRSRSELRDTFGKRTGRRVRGRPVPSGRAGGRRSASRAYRSRSLVRLRRRLSGARGAPPRAGVVCCAASAESRMTTFISVSLKREWSLRLADPIVSQDRRRSRPWRGRRSGRRTPPHGRRGRRRGVGPRRCLPRSARRAIRACRPRRCSACWAGRSALGTGRREVAAACPRRLR